MKRYIFILLFMFASTEVLAQERLAWDPEQRMSLINYVVVVKSPSGFYQSFRSGDFPEIIEEFIPNGQRANNWSQFFSVGFLGASRNLRKLAETKEQLFQGLCGTYQPHFSREGTKTLTYEFAYTCLDPQISLTPKGDGADLKAVDITLTRYEVIDANLYQYQRTWQGSRQEFQAIEPSLDSYLSRWMAEIESISVCRLDDLSNPCRGLDREDAGGTYGGEAVGVFTISGNGAAHNVSLIIDQDDIRTFRGMENMAKDLAARSRNGADITISVRPQPGKVIGRMIDRKKLMTFFVFLRNDTIDAGVAAEKIDFALYNFLEP